MTASNSTIHTIIFDFGGVLLEWNPRNLYRHYFDTGEAMEQFLEEINFFQWNAGLDKGHPFSEGVAELSEQYPQYKDLIVLFQNKWEQCVGQPVSRTIGLIRQLQLSGYAVYGLSNWSSETFPIVRKKFPFFDILDGYMISGDVRLVKPDPAIFQLFLNRFNQKAEECLFIDDSQKNVEAAQEIGFSAIHYQSPEQLEQELKQLNLM
jgi:2-haloacid dehalogenase